MGSARDDMLNRNIPMYEGALPYLYACFSPEDEMLVLPILGRMYNEGFRLWSAGLSENVSDFVAVRHVSTSACVIMFMSHSMLERIHSGEPEVLAACRSSLLRTVVLLDDARPDNRMFALTSPEHVEYQRSNDAPFWLFAYSADYLERCRGPWPEVKVEMREPTFEDVHQEVIAEEYISLEKIITRGGTKPEQIGAPQRHPNNKGYIAPKPDELTYEPLKKVEAAKTVHDRDYDDAISLLNQCAEKQVDIIINHTRPGENTVPAKPSLSPIKPMPDKQAEMRAIRRELEMFAETPERPERKIDPEVRTKADMVVQPDDKQEEIPELPTIVIPVEDLSPRAIAEGIEQIAAAVEAETEEGAPEETATDCVPEEETQPQFLPVTEIQTNDDGGETVASNSFEGNGKSTVQVVVRRQQAAVRVTPVKKRIITEPVRTSSADENRAPKLSRSPYGGHLRSAALYDNVDFEQYIRDIALSAVSAGTAEAEEAPVSRRRFGRASRASAQENTVVTVNAAVRPVAEPEAIVETKAETQENAADESEGQEKTTARKNRYPHNSGMLTGLLAALRHERATEAAEEQEVATQDSEELVSVVSEAHDEVKVIRLSDAISERKVSDLQAAVNRFMRLDGSSEGVSAPLTVRTYGIRR